MVAPLPPSSFDGEAGGAPNAFPVNKSAEQANAIIQLVEDVLSPAIEAALIAQFPALGAPVIKQIVVTIEHVAEDKLTKMAKVGVDFMVYDAQTAAENTRLGRAMKALKEAALSGDPRAIERAQDEYDAAQSALVNADGSART